MLGFSRDKPHNHYSFKVNTWRDVPAALVGVATGGVFGPIAKKLTRSDASPKAKAWIAAGAATANLVALGAVSIFAPHIGALALAHYVAPSLVGTAGAVGSDAIAEPGIHVEHDVQEARAEAADEHYSKDEA